MNDIRANRKFEQLENADSYNTNIRKGWMPFWVKNAAENYAKIKEEFREDNRDAGALVGQPHHDYVLLLGSGPSLNDIEPYLESWEGDIMVSSSQLAFCEALGITPTYCFIIDADPTQSFLVTEADTKNIKLVTHANMDPVILNAWEGPHHYFRMQDPGDDWFGEYMPMMYAEFMDQDTKERWPGINAYVLNSGNVTNTMIAVSNFLGYKATFLCGADLGFPGGDYRFINYKRLPDGKFEKEEKLPIPEGKPLKDGADGMITDQVDIFYKYSTMILWGMDCPNLYSCSRGLLREIPHIPPQDVVALQGDIGDKYEVPNDVKYKTAQTYLRYRGIYIMKGKPRVKKRPSTKKKYVRTKKLIIRWMLFTQRIRGKETPESKKNVIHMMMNAPRVKFRLWIIEWEFSPEETTRVWLGYTGITNKSSVKGFARMRLVLRFNLGRIVGLW